MNKITAETETTTSKQLQPSKLRGLFSSCESAEYRHWLFGCRDCPSGCVECEGKFIGSPDCLRCSTGIFTADGECFSCDEGEYAAQGSELECVSCDELTPYCTACELMTG